jgi:hypothetical protein
MFAHKASATSGTSPIEVSALPWFIADLRRTWGAHVCSARREAANKDFSALEQ